MPKKMLEPEEIIKRKLERIKVGQGDIYDILGHLVREYGLGEVADQLSTYLTDQTEQVFGQVEDTGDGGGLQGLAHARALDVCQALTSSLTEKAKEYDL